MPPSSQKRNNGRFSFCLVKRDQHHTVRSSHICIRIPGVRSYQQYIIDLVILRFFFSDQDFLCCGIHLILIYNIHAVSRDLMINKEEQSYDAQDQHRQDHDKDLQFILFLFSLFPGVSHHTAP